MQVRPLLPYAGFLLLWCYKVGPGKVEHIPDPGRTVNTGIERRERRERGVGAFYSPLYFKKKGVV